MSELAPPSPNTNYGTNSGIANHNYANGVYENGQPHSIVESLYVDSLFQTSIEDLDSEGNQTNRESLFFKTGYAVGRLMMKGSAFIETVRANSNNEATKFGIEDLNEDMSILRGEIKSPDKQVESAPGSELNAFQEYAEFDGLRPVMAPKISEINTSDRNLSVKTESGEEVTEAEYISRFMEDMAENPDFRDKLQWIGEKELVFAMAEQTKWLVGRVLAGDSVLVVGEAWNRKNSKSGDYISKLIVDAAKKTIESEGIDVAGKIITDDDLKEDEPVEVDRAVMFDDWIVSGHDMGYRARWTTRMLNERGVSQDKLTINLLAAQNDLLQDGFDGNNNLPSGTPNIPVIAPIMIEGGRGVNGGLFSGIHSDADYSFTNRSEMLEAIDKRKLKDNGASSYGISSIDTLGNASFYQNLESKVHESLAVATQH